MKEEPLKESRCFALTSIDWLNRVLCGDNCDILGQIPKESIDLVVTSPPYDSLRQYGGHAWDFFGVAWQLKRVLKPGGVIVWVVADQTKNGNETGTSFEQALHFKRLELNLHDTMIWNKYLPGDFGARYCQAFEYMFVISKGKPTAWNPQLKPNLKSGQKQRASQRSGGSTQNGHKQQGEREYIVKDFGVRENVWRISPQDRGFVHPAKMPLELAGDLIKSWSNPGGIVLDPFAGSGTSLVAAKRLNRNFVGIEINPEYCEIAESRLIQDVLPLASTEAV